MSKASDRFFERAPKVFGPRLTAMLESLRERLIDEGWECGTVTDLTCEEVCYTFTAKRTDRIVHVSAKMLMSEDYGDPPAGVTFAVEVMQDGGLLLTGVQPYNYTPACWVRRRDLRAVEARLTLVEECVRDMDMDLHLVELCCSPEAAS